MEYSYDFKHASDMQDGQAASGTKTRSASRIGIQLGLQTLAGAIFFGALLTLSWNQEGLYFKEIAAVTAVCGLISLIRYRTETNPNDTE